MNKKKTFLRLFSYLGKEIHLLILAILATLISNIASIYTPKLTGYAIDAIGINQNVDFDVVYKYCIQLIVLYLIILLFSYILQRILIEISKRITSRMRKEIFEHLGKLSVNFFDNHRTGNIISRISYDVDTINTSLSSDIIHLVTGAITVFGSLIMMMTISPLLILVFVVTIPISIILMRYRMNVVKPLFRARSGKLGELNGFTEEMLSGNKTIKIYGAQKPVFDKYENKNRETSDVYYNADYQGTIMGPSMGFINNLTLALISMFGAILFLFGKISIGNISSFVMYSRKFAGPINETANIITEIQSALAAAERVFAILDEPVEKEDHEDAVSLNNVEGHVKFENVHFGYEADEEILHGITLEAKPGEVVAIVGPTGAGKTTIINVLMRFYEIQNGNIYLDGTSIYDIKKEELRKAFSLVLQDTWIFEGSIADNVAYANPSATREEIIEVCKKACIHNFIESLPDGYDTIIHDDGVNISKGQKQLLTIARAMLSNSKMLILDEATSNVDSKTEIQIQKAIFELMKNKTCFVIAHRLSTIQNADKILVLKDGDIIETGNHEQLLEQKGFYHKLFNSQYV